jgi:ketosteroid isomerase-like protein
LSANLDLVRSIFEAWERGDYSSAEWAHLAIEFVIVEGSSPGRSTGLAGMAAAWREFLSAWEDYRIEADEYRDLDGERVLVLVHSNGRNKTSGLELRQMQTTGGTCLFHVRSGSSGGSGPSSAPRGFEKFAARSRHGDSGTVGPG